MKYPASRKAATRKDSPGLSSQDEEHGARAARPASLDWITDDLVAETRRVWSAYLGRVLGEEEAIEMLVNVRTAAQAIMTADEKGVHI